MKERERQIIITLLKNRNYKITDLEDILQLTKRQINYSINKINSFLSERDMEIIERTSKGYFKVPEEIFKVITDEQVILDYFSSTERLDWIYIYLFIYPDEISLFHLMDLLEVSKNTIVNDIKELNEQLIDKNIKIKFSRKKGYYISGDEYSIRLYINELIRKNIKFNRSIAFKDIDENKYLNEAIHVIAVIEKELGIRYSDDSFLFLINAIEYTLLRINVEFKEIKFNEFILPESTEFKVLKKYYGRKMNRNEILWLTLLFSTSNLYMNPEEFSSDRNKNLLSDIENLINEMLYEFENYLLIEIEDKEKFRTRLMMHMRPAIFRMIYNISIEDYSSKVLDNEELIILPIIRKIIKPIENFIGKKVPEDELKLITLYFETQLYEKKSEILKPRAAVVCSNGLVVSKIVYQMLTKLFPELSILATMSSREFSILSSDFDLVFTTTPLKVNIPQYLVNPTLTASDQIQLRQNVLNDLKISGVENTTDRIMKAIENYIENDKFSNVKSIISQILVDQGIHAKGKYDLLPNLIQFVRPNNVQIIDEVSNWEEAIKIAFQPMLDSNIVSHEYVEDCIRQMNYETNFAYFGSYTAIPHSNINSQITQDNIGILIIKKSVKFPKLNEIRCIAPIAVNGTNRHIKAINQLADIVQNEVLFNKMIKSSNKNQIINLIRGEE